MMLAQEQLRGAYFETADGVQGYAAPSCYSSDL